MGGLQCWDDALKLRQASESLQCLLVCHCKVLSPLDILEVGVLWADARVVQTAKEYDSKRSRMLRNCTKQQVLERGTQSSLGLIGLLLDYFAAAGYCG